MGLAGSVRSVHQGFHRAVRLRVPHRQTAVSYTHLDVYKRQGEGIAVLDEVGVVALDEHIRLADGEGLVVDLPVSYTHLPRLPHGQTGRPCFAAGCPAPGGR